MLRLLYADQGGKRELLQAVRATRDWALGHLPDGVAQVRGYLADGGPFPERLHLIALFADFYDELFELLIRWADDAESEIQRWPGTTDLGMTDRTRQHLETVLARMEAGWHPAPNRPDPAATQRPARIG